MFSVTTDLFLPKEAGRINRDTWKTVQGKNIDKKKAKSKYAEITKA